MTDVIDRLIQIQSALAKAHGLTIKIRKKFQKESTINHINILENYLIRAKKKLKQVKKSATDEELSRKV